MASKKTSKKASKKASKKPAKTVKELEVTSVKEAMLKLDKARRSEVLAAVNKLESDARQAEYEEAEKEAEKEIEKACKDKDILKYLELLDDAGDTFAMNHWLDSDEEWEGFFKYILKQGAEIVEICDSESVKFRLPTIDQKDYSLDTRSFAALLATNASKREKILIRIIENPPTDFSIKRDVVYICWS